LKTKNLSQLDQMWNEHERRKHLSKPKKKCISELQRNNKNVKNDSKKYTLYYQIGIKEVTCTQKRWKAKIFLNGLNNF